MCCRANARFSREEQVTATRSAVDTTRTPACSHEGDRGGLQTRHLLQQRSGRHASWQSAPAGGRTCRRPPCPAVDSRHTPTVGSNSGQEAPAASLRPSSSGRLETCPQQNFRLPFTGRLLAPRRRPRATFMKHSAVPGSQPGSFMTFFPAEVQICFLPPPNGEFAVAVSPWVGPWLSDHWRDRCTCLRRLQSERHQRGLKRLDG